MAWLTPIDPKYAILAEGPARIVKVTNPEDAVPPDEPLILFRARDMYALPMLLAYLDLCTEAGCTDFHIEGIRNRIEAFVRFAAQAPDRMKEPGITRGF